MAPVVNCAGTIWHPSRLGPTVPHVPPGDARSIRAWGIARQGPYKLLTQAMQLNAQQQVAQAKLLTLSTQEGDAFWDYYQQCQDDETLFPGALWEEFCMFHGWA